MNHPKPGTVDYERHVQEEIEYFSSLFKEGEGRETLHQPIPPSWQEAERRAAMLINEKTGNFLGGHIEKRLNSRPCIRLLSLGSGACGMEIDFAKTCPQAKIVCMDLNADLLELGRERARQLGLNMEFTPTDLNTVDLPRNEFDFVYCAAALHHVIELERLAEQIKATLRPEGEFVIVDVITQSGYLMWPETREAVRNIWKTLPARFRINHTCGPKGQVDEEVWESDTSQHGMECVRSGDILAVLEQAFEVKHFVPYFSISRRFLDTMYGPNYDLSASLDAATFNWIWALDRHYLESRQLRPETFFGVYQPKKPKRGLLARLRGSF
ncbi:MAG TPA: class I SAM-dependent methyltransferase [Pyrinomonadaceae bacterium]|nr:class I SAM-dependent methyltransferase [Pyrinomonadaceae bacterium]